MKKFLTLAALLVVGFSVNQAKAQTTTGTANLNVTLAAAQNISVTSAAVELEFSTAEHYNTGVETPVANHITASSSGGFMISVKANSANLVGPNTSVIPVTTLSVVASAGTYNPAPGSPNYQTVASINNTVNQPVVTSGGGANAATFNIKYKASGGADYINKETGSYVATLTYTIAPN